MIATIRTTSGREHSVLETVSAKISRNAIPVKSLLYTEEIRGYIFIEGEINDIEVATKGIPHVRGLISKPVPVIQLERFMIPEKMEMEVRLGDIVEIIGSPFKGERGKVTRIDDTKNEVTVEFLEAAIPIPVTISMNSIRIYEKKKSA